MVNKSGHKPMEYKVLIKPIEVEEKTESGIIIPEAARDKEANQVQYGTLIDFSPLCFDDPDWKEKPKVGDKVMFERYGGGMRFKGMDGEYYRVMNDKEIKCVVNPAFFESEA